MFWFSLSLIFSLSPAQGQKEPSVRTHSGYTHSDIKSLITNQRTSCTGCQESCWEDNTPTVINQSDVSYCINGISSGLYPCKNINLISHLTISDLDGCETCYGNDIWGWTYTNTTTNIKSEYVLAGLEDGTAVVNINDPFNPIVTAYIDSQDSTKMIWRDIKIYQEYAYIVAENANSVHGLQYVHLPTLINTANNYYNNGGSGVYHLLSSDSNNINLDYSNGYGIIECHNVFVNEDTAYLYAVGCKDSNAAGGLIILNLDDPGNPYIEGVFAEDGYTHDVQCVVYTGPDTTYTNHEICFAYNEDALTIVDVNNKSDMSIISTTYYSPYSEYTHQGWIDSTQTYLFLDDELDEYENAISATRTFIFDIRDLSNPIMLYNENNEPFESNTHYAIDHNHYIVGDLLLQAHYRAGLRVIDISNVLELNNVYYDNGVDYYNNFINNNLTNNEYFNEIGYFDTYINDDEACFNGAWSVFPYFESGVIAIQDIEKGLFLLQLDWNGTDLLKIDFNSINTMNPTSMPSGVPSMNPSMVPTSNPVIETTTDELFGEPEESNVESDESSGVKMCFVVTRNYFGFVVVMFVAAFFM